MKIITVNSKVHGIKEIFVDDEDFDLLSKYKWYICKDKNTFYAQRNIYSYKKQKTRRIYRDILNINDSEVFIDHIDHDGLNCQRNNLRICNNSQNAMNRQGWGTSKYLGVYLKITKYKDSLYKRWATSIKVNNKRIYLGVFPHTNEGEIAAAKAYDEAAKCHFKEFANLNFK